MRDDQILDRPLALGDLALRGRLVQAGLRRGQPVQPGVALALAPPAWIVPEGAGPDEAAGIWRDADTTAWRHFTDACATDGVPAALPLWHAGRLSHPLAQPGGGTPVAPPAIAAEGGLETWAGWRPFAHPRALREDELPGLARHFAEAARRARQAGFDAVEVHAGGGGLLHQFLDPEANHRPAPHGGTAEDRARLPIEVALAVARVAGPGRTGLVLPWPDGLASLPALPAALALLRGLRPAGLAWLRLEALGRAGAEAPIAALRDAFGGPVILGAAGQVPDAASWLRDGLADAVALHHPPATTLVPEAAHDAPLLS
ncbi:oxidoreductase [Falsiroseomonas ponticola]|uniref:oxidoreductase n=1 Tax=Falsiroseomonas ponticola TaxID=2786951 RepID=UPI001933544B|nr:hypothetical protein [Roseomonas ponticola]